jgi:hypothetical protein
LLSLIDAFKKKLKVKTEETEAYRAKYKIQSKSVEQVEREAAANAAAGQKKEAAEPAGVLV